MNRLPGDRTVSLNPYLQAVNDRTANRETWNAAPAWVRRQSIHGNWLKCDKACRAVALDIVGKYRSKGDVRRARWYMDSIKAGPSA